MINSLPLLVICESGVIDEINVGCTFGCIMLWDEDSEGNSVNFRVTWQLGDMKQLFSENENSYHKGREIYR